MRLDAVLFTHKPCGSYSWEWDDLRPLSFLNPENLPLYADDATAETIERVFDYTFRTENRYPNDRARGETASA